MGFDFGTEDGELNGIDAVVISLAGLLSSGYTSNKPYTAGGDAAVSTDNADVATGPSRDSLLAFTLRHHINLCMSKVVGQVFTAWVITPPSCAHKKPAILACSYTTFLLTDVPLF